MKQLRNAQGILSSDMPTGNLVWVDPVNGNDLLAVRGRLAIPFRTLTAAKNAAQSGDTIVVMPGSYNERDLAKDGVNWHFLSGAIVSWGGGTGGLFDVTAAMTFNVSGDGVLGISSGFGSNYVLNVTSASTITFKCQKMSSPNACIRVTNGNVLVRADSAISNNDLGVDISGGTVMLRIRSISGNSSHGVNITGGIVEIEAFHISSNAGKGLYFSGGTATVQAVDIYSSQTHGVEYSCSSASVLTLVGVRIFTLLTTSSTAKAVYVSNGTASGKSTLKLVRCTLLSQVVDSGSRSIDSAAACVVGIYGEGVANLAKGANVTTQVSNLLIDANVT